MGQAHCVGGSHVPERVAVALSPSPTAPYAVSTRVIPLLSGGSHRLCCEWVVIDGFPGLSPPETNPERRGQGQGVSLEEISGGSGQKRAEAGPGRGGGQQRVLLSSVWLWTAEAQSLCPLWDL